MNCIEDKCKSLTAKYHPTRQALLKLISPGNWERELKELNDGDLMMPDSTETSIENASDEMGPDGCLLSKKHPVALERGLREGRHVVSWIWRVKGSTGDGEDEGLNKGMSFVVEDIKVLSFSQLYMSSGPRCEQGAYGGQRR